MILQRMPSHIVAAAAALALAIGLASQGAASAQATSHRPAVTVGAVLDGPDRTEDGPLAQRASLLDRVREEVDALMRRDFDVRFPESKRRTADFTRTGVRAAIDALLADPEVDIVLSLGPFATHELARRADLPKPVIAAWAVDPSAQGLPLVGDATGVRNLNYIVSRGAALDDLRRLSELVDADTVHVLIDAALLDAIPEIPQNITREARNDDLNLIPVPVGADPDEALARLPADAQAVYVTPLLQVDSRGFDRLVAGLIERRLPSFSLLGEEEVERGILAGLRARTELPRLARRMALNLKRVLEGESAGALPVRLEGRQRLTINMATARAVGVYPSWRTLLEAVQLHPDPEEAGPVVTFDEAVRQAVDANLSLQAARSERIAADEDVPGARANLLPQLDAFARGLRIDDDRAAASFGAQAERSVAAGLSLGQVVYSDGALAGLRISRDLRRSRAEEYEGLRLDTALAAAQAYLDVLRASTLERVARENLRLTESNLDRAVRREEIGAAGPGDVYRWRAELANDRAAVIAARQRTLQARVALNRLRDRPLEEPFRTESPDLNESWLITCCDRLEPYIDNPAAFERFREFNVVDGLQRSVELRALDAAIDAQERARVAARRSFWAPTVGLRLDFERELSRGGAGSTGPSIPGLPVALATADRDDWSVALQAGLPLYRGGARGAEVRQATEALTALRLQRDAAEQALEARIRVALFETGITYPSIELAREAAAAAEQNLGLVTDAYTQGVVSIIELLDAQNASLSARAAAANAEYEFLLDLMEVQRATNNLDFFRSDAARDAWVGALESFFDRED